MSLQPGIFENEEGERNLPFGDDQNTPFYATSKGDRSDGPGVDSVERPTVQIEASSLSTEAVQGSHVLMWWEATHSITWINDNGVKVVNATWQGYDQKGSLGVIKSVKNPASQPGAQSARKRASTTELEFQQGKSAISLPIGDAAVNKYQKGDMYLVLGWEKNENGDTGYTKSGVFTVYKGNNNDNDFYALRDSFSNKFSTNETLQTGEDITDSSPFFPARTGNGLGDLSTTTTTTGLPTMASATSVIPSSTSVSGGDNDESGSGSGGSGGGGLAPGAIAGIVIGAVFGVAIIAFLIWFLLRRRRRRADHVQNGGYGPGGPHEYLADKESHARVVESPHSPYSDDGQTQQHQSSQRHLNDIGQAPAAAAAIAASSANNSPTDHHHRPPFAPYNEQEHTSVASRSLDNVNSDLEGARSSTPNVNSNVSHLIEDGMTEDEIRRLEEEERALDAAIEQAGQGGQRR